VNQSKEEQTNKALTSIDLIVSAIVLTLHADIDTGSGMVSFERWLKRSSLSGFFDQFLLVFRRNQEFRRNRNQGKDQLIPRGTTNSPNCDGRGSAAREHAPAL
jgi:hypothetical protein